MADPKYPSTLLPQENTPEQIQKGHLDLLKKVNESYAENAAAASAASTAAAAAATDAAAAAATAAGKTTVTHEYVSNSSATNADDTTSFVTGTTGEGDGVAGGGSVGVIRTTALTAVRVKGVQFANAIKAGDLIYLEFYNGVNWINCQIAKIATIGGLPIIVDQLLISGGAAYGIGVDVISSTRINVLFGNYMKFQNAGASLDWNNAGINVGTQWRVHKISFS